MENDQYQIFRYFVIPTSNQKSLYDDEKPKEERFKDMLLAQNNKKKIVFTYWNTRHMLFFEQFENNSLFFFRYAKEIVRKKKIEGEKSITEVEDSELKSVNIFLDLSNQFVLIQKKTTEFSKSEHVKKSLESLFSSKLKEFFYVVKIDEIPFKQEFWNFIKAHKKIRTLFFKLNSPNFFFGNPDTREALSLVKEEYNNDEITFSMKNHQDELVVSQNIAKFVDYVSTVGGEYFVEAKANGRIIVFKSKDNIRSISIPENWQEEDINNLISKIDQVQKDLKDESTK